MKKITSILTDFRKLTPQYVLLSVVGMMALFTSCKKDRDPDQIFKGSELTMGNGKATTFFKISAAGTPLEIGFEMTKDALTNLNQDPTNFAASTFVLNLDQKARDYTPFEHLVINWQPGGHPPAGVYTVPHFDFHFYQITLAERMAIPPYSPSSAAQFDLLPPAGYMPASWSGDPGGIPAMGKHWADPQAPRPFSHMMIYGSYNGQVIFTEPMVTLAVLQAGSSINLPFAQPQLFAKTGKWYPTKYNIYQDMTTLSYYVTLSEFVKR